MKLARTLALLVGAVALLTTPTWAQTIDVNALPAPVPGAPSTPGGILPLDLEDAYQLALARSPISFS